MHQRLEKVINMMKNHQIQFKEIHILMVIHKMILKSQIMYLLLLLWSKIIQLFKLVQFNFKQVLNKEIQFKLKNKFMMNINIQNITEWWWVILWISLMITFGGNSIHSFTQFYYSAHWFLLDSYDNIIFPNIQYSLFFT
jgi:hypothetical protein